LKFREHVCFLMVASLRAVIRLRRLPQCP